MTVEEGRAMYDQERGDRRRDEREVSHGSGSLAGGRDLYMREHGNRSEEGEDK